MLPYWFLTTFPLPVTTQRLILIAGLSPQHVSSSYLHAAREKTSDNFAVPDLPLKFMGMFRGQNQDLWTLKCFLSRLGCLIVG